MDYYEPKKVKNLQVPPTMFGPFGRKWLDLSGLSAKYKIAQGPEFHPSMEGSKEPPKQPKQPENINISQPRKITTEERMQSPPANKPETPTHTPLPSKETTKLPPKETLNQIESTEKEPDAQKKLNNADNKLKEILKERTDDVDAIDNWLYTYMDTYIDQGAFDLSKWKNSEDFAKAVAYMMENIGKKRGLVQETTDYIKDAAYDIAIGYWNEYYNE